MLAQQLHRLATSVRPSAAAAKPRAVHLRLGKGACGRKGSAADSHRASYRPEATALPAATPDAGQRRSTPGKRLLPNAARAPKSEPDSEPVAAAPTRHHPDSSHGLAVALQDRDRWGQ